MESNCHHPSPASTPPQSVGAPRRVPAEAGRPARFPDSGRWRADGGWAEVGRWGVNACLAVWCIRPKFGRDVLRHHKRDRAMSRDPADDGRSVDPVGGRVVAVLGRPSSSTSCKIKPRLEVLRDDRDGW